VQALDGDRGWLRISAQGDSIMDEDSLGVVGLRGIFRTDLVHLLLTAADARTQLAYRGGDEITARAVDVVEMVVEGGQRWVLFLDRDSHRLAALEENAGSVLAGPALRRVYGEYRLEQGISWPHFEDRLLNGAQAMTIKTEHVQFNTGLTAEAFANPRKPAGPPRPRGR
jgi:hypothetical protein